jgi:serine protease Do
MQGPQREHSRKILKARRLTLLGSVAVIGAAVAFGGPLTHAVTPAYSATQTTEAQNGPPGFADLVAKVKPAVISVRVKMDQSADEGPQAQNDDEQNMPEQFRNSPFEKFFRQFGDNGPMGEQGGPRANMRRQHQVITGLGSGFFISADGYAVTNNHVVDHAKSVEVKTDDGKTYTAKVIGTDPKTDIALIKVDGRSDFTYVNFEDHPARIGDWVVAVGNPFGLGGTVTAGIVSASGRDIGSGPYDDYIQIDAPINKGNSGGPTFDMNGNVIGVNTAIYSPSGGSVGIGFDIPAQTAKLVIAQLKDKGAVTRGYIGVQVQPVTQDIADSLGLKTASGALVAEPQSDGPAAKAGIKAGDVITSVNGTAVKDSRDLARQISEMAPGATAKLDVTRNGEQKTVSVTLEKMPNQQQASNAAGEEGGAETGAAHLGITVAPASGVAGAGARGVVITGIDPDGPAAEHGLQSGDVILDVAGKSVGTPNDLRQALSDAKSQGKHDVLMRVKTAENGTHFVAMPIG